MQLTEYLDWKRLSAVAFAASIDVRFQTIYRYMAGERMPSPAIMKRIAAATDGAVQPNDWYGEYERVGRRRRAVA